MRTAAAALSVVVLFAAGCGGGSDKTTASTADQPTASTASATVTGSGTGTGPMTVHMSEFKFDPAALTVRAGVVTISAPNDGSSAHELVLLKTDADPAHLPMKGGEVDESSSVGEIADVAPGATKSHTFTLAPGKYAMVCNLPGHYASGMYGSLTVK